MKGGSREYTSLNRFESSTQASALGGAHGSAHDKFAATLPAGRHARARSSYEDFSQVGTSTNRLIQHANLTPKANKLGLSESRNQRKYESGDLPVSKSGDEY